jgi:hypothetical protein
MAAAAAAAAAIESTRAKEHSSQSVTCDAVVRRMVR